MTIDNETHTPRIGDNTHEKKNLHLTPIQNFFAGTNIFLTGGTGFLGVLILEKLLISCQDVSRIYLLIRNKKGKDVETRLEELYEGVVMSRVRERCPNFKKKIVPVEGDCELPGLGLNTQDEAMITQEVDVIFHAAATVRFDENLKKASIIHIRAVRDIIQLARGMPNLKSFVHVSTVFSNCVQKFIKEDFYPPSIDYKKLLSIIETLSEDTVNIITPVLLGDYPNTYSYTKQIGEDVIRQEGKGLPIGIHRPSIVISTLKEPMTGWTNNFYGPTGLIVGVGLGLIRAVKVDTDIPSNLVPADMVVNSIIASAWDIAERARKDRADVPIYNFEASQGGNMMKWGDYMNTCLKYGLQYYPSRSLWYMFYIPCRTDLSYTIWAFFLHTIPGLLIDGIRICLRKRPVMMKLYHKIDKMSEVLKYFSKGYWEFQSDNSRGLVKRMSVEDLDIFYCDMKRLDWKEYLQYYVVGCRLYLTKDPLETIPKGKRNRRRLYVLHQLTKASLAIFLLWSLWSLFSLVFNVIG